MHFEDSTEKMEAKCVLDAERFEAVLTTKPNLAEYKVVDPKKKMEKFSQYYTLD